MNRITGLWVAGLLGMAAGLGAHAQTPSVKPAAQAPTASGAAGGGGVRQLDVSTKHRTGDFDAMLERRSVRVYVPYSRSLYFLDKGRERGSPPT